ncbi:hypothetical protein MGAST_23310 [Mycobacterium gastri 'Wayne']|nr:hypothetical protein MGAST_23310 [Mycobacterium gastri 'Wayne']
MSRPRPVGITNRYKRQVANIGLASRDGTRVELVGCVVAMVVLDL